VPPERRTARFRTIVAVELPDGRSFLEEGTCEGVIAYAPAGEHGFGYDPVFFYPPLGKTLAQLSTAEKNQVSHRSIAAARMREKLRELALKTA
jgi:XTP/dITP diphosphohydrolase